ncbi:MAG: hypothetical protein JKY95_07080 [Planctomycetaceae bacterium]|nr:hypothetical protein [Planctomycetaceae bacterium]
MFRQWLVCLLPVAALNLIFLSGCGEAVDPQVVAARDQWLLTQSPGEADPIATAREAEQGAEFIISGKVGVTSLPEWWVDGYATFWITEASEAVSHGGPGHDPDTCPFCRRKYKESVAVIQCVDDQDIPLKIDARTLFNLKEGDFVTVKGHGSIDESGILNVAASGVYIQSKP